MPNNGREMRWEGRQLRREGAEGRRQVQREAGATSGRCRIRMQVHARQAGAESAQARAGGGQA